MQERYRKLVSSDERETGRDTKCSSAHLIFLELLSHLLGTGREPWPRRRRRARCRSDAPTMIISALRGKETTA
ncbi:hypothetical protein PUN28_007833 [Cardiocondyla obscurior]|uniref:Uncharacterized protein n=1 Tax=Cardiocondyla obscurior TaxID=286306 RepID=A0AAW2FWB1_9HYME